MSTDAPNPFVLDYDPVAEEIEQVAKAEYQRGRLEGARIVRDLWRADLAQLRSRFRPELVHEIHDDDAAAAMGGADAAIESAQAHIPDDAQLQKLIEGEG